MQESWSVALVCVVVTQNGRGLAYKFVGLPQARLHPLAEQDDVYAESAAGLLAHYGGDEDSLLLRWLPEGGERTRCAEKLARWRSSGDVSSERVAQDVAGVVWAALLKVARRPPDDPAEVVRLIVEGRRARESVVIRSRPDLAELERRRTPERASKEPRSISVADTEHFRMSDEGTITIGSNDQGVKYDGGENCPYKQEDKKAKFGALADGMTVKQAEEAGLTRSDIRRARRAGYITVTNPPEPEKTEDEKSKKGKKAEAEAAGDAE